MLMRAILWGRRPRKPHLSTGLRLVFNSYLMDILIGADRIQERVGELACQIAADFRARQPFTIVGVLTGSLIFLADLVRRLDVPLRIGLIQASSYRGAATTPGELLVQPDLQPDVRGRHVLLLDDILDTGRTLAHLTRHLHHLGAASVRVAVLLRKRGRQEVDLEPDYCGFEIPNAFVVGYGLDHNDEYRHLPYVAVLPESPLQKPATV
jgi:hypoxanthine phosphoribosyltransferase